MAPALDHIVLLVPHSQLLALPAWLTDAFTVVYGGQHAGGATENKLILLPDGVYIEIIAFVPGGVDGRPSHRWGAQPAGHIIDWALSLTETDHTDERFADIQARVRAARAGLAYQDLAPGGRTTPDGVVLQWATSAPAAWSGDASGGDNDDDDDDDDALGAALTGGALPFWCLDRTPRAHRVPYAADGGRQAQHPSQAVGVAGVTLHVADAALRARLQRVYDAILVPAPSADETNETNKTNKNHKHHAWTLAVPETPAHGKAPRLQLVPLDARAAAGAPQGWIELSLFTTGEARTVGGHLVDGWRIDIRLEKA